TDRHIVEDPDVLSPRHPSMLFLDGRLWPSAMHYVLSQSLPTVTEQERVRACPDALSAEQTLAAIPAPLLRRHSQATLKRICMAACYALASQDRAFFSALTGTGASRICDQRQSVVDGTLSGTSTCPLLCTMAETLSVLRGCLHTLPRQDLALAADAVTAVGAVYLGVQ
ncbi:hypothetical protein KIPB_015914, partial [Kipferlia bialata]